MSSAADLTLSLFALADRAPDARALHAPGCVPLTFAALGAGIERTAAVLRAAGLRRGDVVAGSPPWRDVHASLLLAMPVSCTYAPLAASLGEDACVELLSRMSARAVVAAPEGPDALASAARRLGLAILRVEADANRVAGRFELALEQEATAAPAAVADGRSAWTYITTTSGTSGRPKLVPSTHMQAVHQARTMGERLAIVPGDVSGHVTALDLALGQRTSFLVPILNGASVECLPQSDIGALVASIDGGRASYVAASFAMLRELGARLGAPHNGPRGRLRVVVCNSGRLEADEIVGLEASLGVPVVSAYGATEFGTACCQRLPPATRVPGAIGTPMGTDARIVDAAGVEVGTDVDGELLVRGPMVFPGYVDDPLTTAAVLHDGWYRSGDLARRGGDGELRIMGRLSEMINRGGDKIAPDEVDTALRAIPGVVDAAAFAVPHARLGQEVVAAVVRDPLSGLTEDGVRARARDALGARAAPRRVWFVDALPRNAAGKVLRAELPARVGFQGEIADEPAASGPARTTTAPSPLEAALGGLWANMLRLRRVDRDADFFLLGGDSLRGSALLDEVRAIFGVDLPVAWLFEEAGTVAGMARCIERARAAASSSRPASIPKRDRAAPVPLTHQQSRVWFLHRLDPTSHAYHEMRWWRVDGPLDADALRRALALVAQRQAVLRTRYVAVDGVPWQVIDEAPRWSLEEVDVSASDDPARAADALILERKQQPFDLALAPPFRMVLMRLAPGHHRLLRVWHHVLSDGLANAEFQDDLGAAYKAARAGRPPDWRPLKIDYADYAAWQARELASPAAQAALEALRARLDGVPTLALATDHARPPVQRHDGDVVTVHVSPASLAALRDFGRTQGATAAITYFAVFQVLLQRLTGDEDFAVGTPVSGRTGPELRPLVGFFANTLAIRADLSGAPSFAEVLRRVRTRLAEALERQDVPFERLVDALGLARDPSRNPLFQVAFGVREDASHELELDGTVIERELGRSRHAKFDLVFFMLERAGEVDVHIEYATGLFVPPTIERMARQFATLVDAIAAAPEAPVGSLPIMDGDAERRVVDASLGAASVFPSTSTVDRCFAQTAAASPDAIAVATAGRAGLDYRALEARANRLARVLVAAGVTRGMRVGVSLGGAEDIATAWLAVLKAGAAYVPIDAELPTDRIAFLFDDARIAHLVTEEALVARLERPRMHVVALDRDAALLACEDPAPLPASTGPDDAAYVIYTSGSTGEPKGVVVPHRAILRLVRGADYLQLVPGDRVAQLARPAFDASTFEFWGALLNGATLVPIGKATALAPRAFAEALALERVSVLFLTTALFNAVAREYPGAFAGCRAVLFGGEAVEVAPVRAVLAAKRPARLVHVYGPTEATTFATWHEVSEVAANAATIPIGRPIANTDAFVLRADGGLAAEGEPGELVLGGPGLALGYLGRDALTAERFVDVDLGAAGRHRVYRTGDRVRWGSGGALEFLGRRDRQVKLRGFRIELDEVEAQLAKLPQVREAAVMIQGESSDTRKLVAWLVPADPDGPPPANLWRDMKRRMPEWMLPGAIMWIPALPLNANGKLDRRALPAPADDAGGGVGGGLVVEPRDMLEATVAVVWSELLGAKSIGVHDHFFEIGGHSLLAARLVDAVERRTGIAVPLTALFADDTIAGMASMLREGARFGDESITALHDDPARTPFVYLHGDFVTGGFYSRALAHALGPRQPMLVVHPLGLRPGEDVPDTIEAMASRHVAALRARRPRGPYVLGGHCNGALVAFEMARQLVASGETVAKLVLIESRAPEGEPAPTEDGERGNGYVRAGALGGFEPVTVDNRTRELNLRYLEAIGRYAGGPLDADLLVINAERSSRGGSDGGWHRFVARTRVEGVPGDHASLLTVHLDRVAGLIREALGAVHAQAPATRHAEAAGEAAR